MAKNIILCAGRTYALAARDDCLWIVHNQTGAAFAVFLFLEDKQLAKLTPADITLCKFDNVGSCVVLVTWTGLIVFLKFDDVSGTVIQAGDHELRVNYKTLRVLYKNGSIIPHRCALEDQYKYNVKDCTFSEGALILVPFMLLVNADFCLVRVQPEGETSFFVRIAYNTNDTLLDGLPTRQALRSPDWQFIYEQGVLDWQLHGTMLFVLTHTCLAEAWIYDHDPTPLVLELPTDRVNAIVSPEYHEFTKLCQIYSKTLHEDQSVSPENESESASEPEFSPIVPPEWEVVLSSTSANRPRLRQAVANHEKIKPRLPNPLTDYVKIVFQKSDDPLLDDVFSDYADTAVSASCPWMELAVTTTTLYLNSMDGIYEITPQGWKPLQHPDSGLPIYAANILASKECLYTQETEDSSWKISHPFSSVAALPEIQAPLLFVSPTLIISSKCPYNLVTQSTTTVPS